MHLVFVYNADAGLFSMLTDYVHKIVRPGTYPCSLCAVTYGNLGMKRRWRTFVEGLPATVEFLHRDELSSRYGVDGAALPAVFEKTETGIEPWLDAATLDACPDLPALEAAVRQRLEGP